MRTPAFDRDRTPVGRLANWQAWLAAICVGVIPGAAPAVTASECHGSVNRGSIEHSVKLPNHGVNFSAYSALAAGAGRTYVHSRVAAIVAAAYAATAISRPGSVYVFGETGLASGGRFRPHRSHQNGTSVDFFVPVKNAQGVSVPLPTGVMTRFGYDIEFDANAQHDGLQIDFDAMAEHLYQLRQAALNQGGGIALVIFDLPYLTRLFATPRGPYLREQLTFMKGKPWVRHDEHYHVDFAIACTPAKPEAP